jgi:serine/threonine protein kinase
MAPEMLKERVKYCFFILLLFNNLGSLPQKEVDIWSLGIILYILLEMKFPYTNLNNVNRLKEEILDKNSVKKIIVYNFNFERFLNCCFHRVR